jgi:chromosome segregation ATPase
LFPCHYGQHITSLTSAALASGLSLQSFATAAQEPIDKPAQSVDKPKQADPEELRKTIRRLTTENEHLRSKLAEFERNRQFNSIQDRLVTEEQRVESLQGQLLELGEREAGLQGRMDELTEQLRPENIEHLPIYGSLRPEQVREATRRRLTGEKQRLQSQIDLLQQTRKRLQASVTSNDLVIQRLRMQLQSSLQQ